jgi:hypothetical protein
MALKPDRAINYWWITASERNPKHAWRWEYFFKNPNDARQSIDWGGPEWIKSKVSFARIEEMRKGDIVVAYQAGEGICGLAYLASDGYPQVEGGVYDSFDLESEPIVWFGAPIPYQIVRELPNAKQEIEFVKVKQGTVFSISKKGFDELLKVILAFNPAQKKAIRQFLGWSAG